MQRPWLQLLDPEIHQLTTGGDGSFEARLRTAKAFNSRCRHKEATAILEQLLEEDRSHHEVWFERIVAEGDNPGQDELDDIHRDLESLRDERPDAPEPRRNLGYVRILQHRFDDAERALKQALERNGADPKALALMGLLWLQRDNPQEAKSWILKALSLQPKDSRGLRLLALACEQMDDNAGAGTQFAAALEQDPSYFWGWHSLGEMLIRAGSTEDGLRCIHRARSLQAAEPASYFLLAELLSEQGHLEAAQTELHQLMLTAQPACVLAEAYAMLGEIRLDSGDRDGAVSYLSLATETDPDSSLPWVALGDVAREDERWEDAIRCYRESLAREPEAADVQIQLGYMLLKTGQHEEAEQCFLAALETDPGEYSSYLGLSECYRCAKRPADQLSMVKQAMALAPEDPDVWNAQGVAMEVNGHLKEATEAYEKALAFSPAHRKAANNLGFVLEKRMNAGEADLKERAILAWKRRLLICRDEGQSLKMAKEHLQKLDVPDVTLQKWLEREPAQEKQGH